MKVLFYYELPFSLAHGGCTYVIKKIMYHLQAVGVEVEPLRWWDEDQKGDIIQFAGRPSTPFVEFAQGKGYKTVLLELLDNTASRRKMVHFAQRQLCRLVVNKAGGITNRLGWSAYGKFDALVYALQYEKELAHYIWNAPLERTHIIPWGLEADVLEALNKPVDKGGDFLISAATITERKNTVLLAEAARKAKVPIVFLGKPYEEDNPYYRRFLSLVDGQYVIYKGFVSAEQKYEWLRMAKGFALLSMCETGCIAAMEAAAAGLPLFLAKKPWATKGYPSSDYIVVEKLDSAEKVAVGLNTFYRMATRQAEPIMKIHDWQDIASRYKALYKKVLTE